MTAWKRYAAYLGRSADAGSLLWAGRLVEHRAEPRKSQLTRLDVTATATYYQALSTLSNIHGSAQARGRRPG